MTALGYILFWLGMIVWAIGDLMFLAVVFRYSLVWFFGCLFVPLLDWVYFAFNVQKTWKPTLIATVGCLMAAVGYCETGRPRRFRLWLQMSAVKSVVV